MSDYLWDGQGEVDEDVQRLERQLAPLRFAPERAVIVSPPDERPVGSPRRNVLATAVLAAAAGIMLAWLWVGRSAEPPERSPATAAPAPAAEMPPRMPEGDRSPHDPLEAASESGSVETPKLEAESSAEGSPDEAEPALEPVPELQRASASKRSAKPSASRARTRRGRTKPRSKTAPGVATEHHDAVPERPPSPSGVLTQEQVMAGVKEILSEARACGPRHGAAAETIVLVHFGIEGATGRVKHAKARPPHDETPLGQCIEQVVQTAQFPQFTAESMGVVYPFRM
jgi:hypothetical protein